MKESYKYLDIYNSFFSSLADYELIDAFVIDELIDSSTSVIKKVNFKGKIQSKLANLPLKIDVLIPLGFPNENIFLTTASLKNYPHLIALENGSYWFCLNTPFVETIEEQLLIEIERLSGWIDKYLNKGEKHETLPNTFRNSSFQLFYDEEKVENNDNIRLKEVCWGVTDCYCDDKNYYPLNLGDNSIKWNSQFENSKLFNKKKLFWFFTNKPPLDSYGDYPKNIKDLNDLVPIPSELNQEFKNLYNVSLIGSVGEQRVVTSIKEYNDFMKDKNVKLAGIEDINSSLDNYKDLLISVGFIFDNEIIWELANITSPIEDYLYGGIIENNPDIIYDKIHWNKTKNINYRNYFGRGRFCQSFMDKNITIIGTGAIGSSLAEILTRGGAKNLLLIDDDIVEHGNICRSAYSILDVGSNKVEALKARLECISPHVNVEIIKTAIYSLINYKSRNDIQKIFTNSDIIFDCTASNELLHCLSTIKINKLVFSVGITNESRDLICVSNKSDNIFEKRKFYLSNLEHETMNFFYDGIGCYHPTFLANYADINSMLNLAVKHINNYIDMIHETDSFIISHTESGLVRNDILTFNQNELDITISISQHCLNEIKNISLNNLPNEFGGYLLGGYSRSKKHIYVTSMLVAEQNFINPSYFKVKDNQFVIKSISEIYNRTKGLIDYLGEWHSHPSMSNNFSSTDLDSIKKQASSDAINTNNPLLCIVSIDKFHFEPKFYIFYDNKLFDFDEN
jgi:integrative and conjugative element protein (TIGR02256 family)